MPVTDVEAFLAGVQVGRRIRLWDATKRLAPPFGDRSILTEYDFDYPVLTESGLDLITEEDA